MSTKYKNTCHQGEGGTLMTGDDIVTALFTYAIFVMILIS